MATHSKRPPVKPRGGSSAITPLFHKTGLFYFWVLNDDCAPPVMNKMLDSFARAGAAGVVLHPRCGLRVPYGGSDWFDLIRTTVQQCAKRGVQVWLYDEDPYPSGACGGRVFIEHPEFEARGIDRFEYNPNLPESDSLFYFPTGNLLWCGLVNRETGQAIDLTGKVGTVRRDWTILAKWDSRFYYPDTPLYHHPRSWAELPEYAVRFGEIPADMKLVAFVARPCGREAIYRGLPDSLNPEATRYFIELTHEKYKKSIGDMFGKEVTAIFTDEPKWYHPKPWTPGMLQDFSRQFGYDLAPRLEDLFSNSLDHRPCLTRLHFRQWCTERFEQAWIKPVANWCKRNNIVFTGHISPEEEPVSQTTYIGNLNYFWRHFGLAGLDLIIPAVGDRDHPMLNPGIVSATANAAQYNLPGTMSETLGGTGMHPDMKKCGEVLLWQTMMGMTSPVIHYCQNSVEGLREYDAPPDFGPMSDHWPAMVKIDREVAKVQPHVRGATQVAPVAILWNVRSWWMQDMDWQNETTGMRRDFNRLLASCLDHQVGTHIIDEIALWDAPVRGGNLTMGRASYSHIIVPACSILHAKTVRKLKALDDAGLRVVFAGETFPLRQQTETALEPIELDWIDRLTIDQATAELPRLIRIDGDATDIRCTAWRKGGKTTRLLMNLRKESFRGTVDGKKMNLTAGKVYVL